MTFTNEEVARSIEVLSQLKESGHLGYAIAKNLRKMKDELQDYLQFKDDLLHKYGQRIGETTRFIIPKENLEAYQQEFGNLPKEKVNIDICTVPEEIFISGNIDSQQMEKILWMVE